MSKEEIAPLPIKHISKTEGERSFDGTVIKETSDYKLVKPRRVFFVQMVKFAPGKSFKDYTDCYDAVDIELKKKYGKTRSEMDCHEIITFATLGRHNVVALWDASDLETFQRVVTVIASAPCTYGSTETQTAITCLAHPPK